MRFPLPSPSFTSRRHDSSRNTSSAVLQRVWLALAGDRRIDARHHPLTLAVDEDTLVLEGELADVAAKTRAVAIAQAFPEIHRVVDRLVVAAPVKMDDAEIRTLYARAIVDEIAFEDCRVEVAAEGDVEPVHEPDAPRGTVLASVRGGIVTLTGKAPSLCHARLAGVLAWWIPGTRAVRNELAIEPPEEDSDDEITDAVRIVLEKEPLVDAAQIGIRTNGGCVTLRGTLPSEEQRRIVERDAWYVLGVLDVDDSIQVHPG